MPEAEFQLGVACFSRRQTDLAVPAESVRALELKETAQAKLLFARCVKSVQVTAENRRLRGLVLRALEEGLVPALRESLRTFLHQLPSGSTAL